MSAIRIFRPKRAWSVSPATVLPTALLARLFKRHWNYTVVLDDHPAGHIGDEQVRVFEVEPGGHRLCIRFLGLRKSEELPVSLKEDEERQFLCGTSGMGWPTLREATPADLVGMSKPSTNEPSEPGNLASSS